MTQPVYKTEEVAAFVEAHSTVDTSVELSKRKHVFADGTVIARRDVFKRIYELMHDVAESAKERLDALSGAQKEKQMAKEDAVVDQEVEESDAVLVEGEVVELSAESKPAKQKKPRKPKGEPQAPRELTEEEKQAISEYQQRYQTAKVNGELVEVELDKQTKGGTWSRFSLEARARMSLAAKKRWQDPERASKLKEQMKRKNREESAAE